MENLVFGLVLIAAAVGLSPKLIKLTNAWTRVLGIGAGLFGAILFTVWATLPLNGSLLQFVAEILAFLLACLGLSWLQYLKNPVRRP